MTDEKPRIPNVGEHVRSIGTLVEIQDVTPPVTTVLDYIFEDQDAELDVFVNGKKLSHVATFNDLYGKDSCVKHAIEEARRLRRSYGPGVELRVTKVTSRTRMRPNQRREQCFYAREFCDFKSLECGCKFDMPEEVREVVWSSNNIRKSKKSQRAS